ncbi:hypothetical protein GCM10022261_31720 [Brevibacterium daeguense]|uniref:Uncharacterized protein n=1 Tax=Brevibacterium daeguense TaxID=909936 RepID=A0ABP8EP16_9MICO
MLASTIQFSNNHQTPTHTHTNRCDHDQGRQKNTHHTGGLFPQDPTACSPHPTTTTAAGQEKKSVMFHP